jgi:hypothetical protein
VADGETTPSETSLREFIKMGRSPILNVVAHETFYDLANAGRPLVMLLLDPATLSTPVDKVGLAQADVPGSVASAFRSLARDERLQTEFVFALLDAAENEEHVREAYKLRRDSAPRIVVLKKKGPTRSHATDTPGDTSSLEGMRAFLETVLSGEAHFEFEGIWGLPDRWWAKMKSYVPALSKLDWLPRWSITGTVGLLVAALLTKLILWMPAPDDVYTRKTMPDEIARSKHPKQS